MSRVFDTCPKAVFGAVLVHLPVGIRPGRETEETSNSAGFYASFFFFFFLREK